MTPSRRCPVFPPHLLAAGCLLLLSVCRVSTVWAQATLENPAPNSAQSGLGVISGWVCDATTIEIQFNELPPQEAAYGTSRSDTQGVCGDSNNGFGLLFNWNILGDGAHTVRALLDGAEFARTQVTVSTFGEEFLRGTRGSARVANFPRSGERRTLMWQESQQNFVITAGQHHRGGGTSGSPPRVLENPSPGSHQSGIGVISGWVCEAGRVEIEFNDDTATRQQAGYGTARGDTAGVCGDTNNGFGLLFNWNLLGDGTHTVRALADGVEFARSTITVTTLGEEYVRGLSREVTLPDFPNVGTDTTLVWQERQQNFIVTTVLPTQRQVSVRPAIALPASVTTVSASDVHVTALDSSTSEVRASPAPTLLLAEDDGGTVLLSLADMDGGLLGESPGQVEASIDSTAVTLVALTAGVALHALDQSIVDEIQTHAQYPALRQAMIQALQTDKNFLDQILTYPEVMRLIQEVATFQTNHAQAMFAALAAAPAPRSLPEGERHNDFIWWSPWDDHEPWRWFDSGILFAPPFLANSLHPDFRSLHATGNPNYVAYALELYAREAYRDWLYITGNESLVDKTSNSGAAQRLITAGPGGSGYRLSPDITQVRFARYRLSVDSTRAGIMSFINTFNMVLSVVHLLAEVQALSTWLDKLGELDDVHEALSPCMAGLVTGLQLPDETAGDAKEQARRFFTTNLSGVLHTTVGCIRSAQPQKLEPGDALEELINNVILKTVPKLAAKTANPAGWVALVLDGANKTVPVLSSYFLPTAGDVDYALEWATTADGTPYIVRVSEQAVRVTGRPGERPGPPARPTNLGVSASGSAVTLRWNAVAGTGIRYVVYQHYGGGRYWAREVAGTSTIFHNRQANTEYCFDVVAVDLARQESAPSDRECGRTDGEVEPPVPTNLRATATASSMTLEWDAVAGTGIRYVVYQHYSGGRHWAREVTETSTTFSGLEADTEYCWDVVAVNAARQESAPSAPQCARTALDDDRAALIALYNATRGANWRNKTNWLGNAPLSQWYGVATDDHTDQVDWLDLADNQLSGPIPSELSRLSNLEVLDLANNQPSGPIPSELSRLSNLEVLDLENNQLSGPIPSELSRLSNLEVLDLANNQLSGPIPSELSRLSNLEVLDLENNQLSGPIPSELSRLSNLEVLDLANNQLSGPIPSELSRLSKLDRLDLDRNQLSGAIPPELSRLSNLKDLDLSDNHQLSGPIPSELSRLSNLEDLDLSDNQLSGSIPPELSRLSNLKDLDLSDNQLSGSIPPELSRLSNLKDLDLSDNQLSGSIPPELSRLSNLEDLDLSDNQLSGSIPPELSRLSNLEDLDLSGNQLTGCIPDGLRDVPQNDFSSLGLPFCSPNRGVRLSRTALSVKEGTGETYTVVLTARPRGTVTVRPVASGPVTLFSSSRMLTFTPSNWNVPQTVRILGVDDRFDNPNDQRTATIRHEVSGGGYDRVRVDSVRVTVIDNDEGVPTEINSVTATCGREGQWRACYHRRSAKSGELAEFAIVMSWEPAGVWRGAWCAKTERHGLCAGQYDRRSQFDKRFSREASLTFQTRPPTGAETFWVVAEVWECNNQPCTGPNAFTEVEFHHIEVAVQPD